MRHEHVRIAVADVEPPGAEEVPARRLSEDEWEILKSPLYATDVASGDVIQVLDSVLGSFVVTKHGGNICVQFYLCELDSDSADATARAVRIIESNLKPLGGQVDAFTPGLIASTVSVIAGFPKIEAAFNDAVRDCPGAEWQFANVYDAESGEPLGWWDDPPPR